MGMTARHWRNVAQAAYEAYIAGMMKGDHGVLVAWDKLSPHEKQAWVDAIREADRLLIAATLV